MPRIQEPSNKKGSYNFTDAARIRQQVCLRALFLVLNLLQSGKVSFEKIRFKIFKNPGKSE